MEYMKNSLEEKALRRWMESENKLVYHEIKVFVGSNTLITVGLFSEMIAVTQRLTTIFLN